MNIIEKLIDAKIVDNGFHAAGMLNVLECATQETDEQRLDRCRLYIAWKKYFDNSKDFTNKTNAKKQARKNAIAGLAVPELPMEALQTMAMAESVLAKDWNTSEEDKAWEYLSDKGEPVPAPEVTG